MVVSRWMLHLVWARFGICVGSLIMKNPEGETSLVPVILAGGDGTRLWPLSRNGLPKPFLKLFGDRTLIQQTIDRIFCASTGLNVSRIVVVTAAQNEHLVRQQLNYLTDVPLDVILEPCGRSTAAAVAAASIQYT